MNWWLLAASALALITTAGHALAGPAMFYRPIKAGISDTRLSGVFTGMWNLITINFALAAFALIVAALQGALKPLAGFVAAQFAMYAVLYLGISLRLGGPLRLFQWFLFALTAVFAALGSIR